MAIDPLIKEISNYPGILKFGPVKHSQGYLVPVYLDFRGAVSQPKLRRLIIKELVKLMRPLKVDIIAGAALSGISWAALVANKLNRPLVFIRAKRKTSLDKRMIEGYFKRNQTAVLIDDTILLGNTKKKMILGAAKEGLKISNIVVVYSAVPFDKLNKRFVNWLVNNKIKIHARLYKNLIIDYFVKKKIVSPAISRLNEMYMLNPRGWHKNKEAKKLMIELKNR